MKGNNFLFSSETASQALLLAHDQGAGEALPHISHLDSSGGTWGALLEFLLLQQLECGKVPIEWEGAYMLPVFVCCLMGPVDFSYHHWQGPLSFHKQPSADLWFFERTRLGWLSLSRSAVSGHLWPGFSCSLHTESLQLPNKVPYRVLGLRTPTFQPLPVGSRMENDLARSKKDLSSWSPSHSEKSSNLATSGRWGMTKGCWNRN